MTTSKSAKKAWETRRVGTHGKKYPNSPGCGPSKAERRTYNAWYAKILRKNRVQEKHKKNYNAPKKNEFRELVVKMCPKRGECLTLDGSQELFSKATPYLKHTIYEYNRQEFRAMQDSPRPRNVETIRPRDIMEAPIYDPGKKYACAFVDWMGTFYTHKKDLERLAPYLDSCQTIAFTFSVWGGHLSIDGKKKGYDYKMDLVGKLMNIFKNFEYGCGMPYCDTSPMVGIILTKREAVNVPAKTLDVYAKEIEVR